MIRLKLMRLPHGTNRNRTLRRVIEADEEEVNIVEVEQLFRRFWRQWHKRGRLAAADGREREDASCA